MRLPAGSGAACPIDVDEGLGHDADRSSLDAASRAESVAADADAAGTSVAVTYGLAALVTGTIGFIAFVALRFYISVP